MGIGKSGDNPNGFNGQRSDNRWEEAKTENVPAAS
jgi:hypothetical protein